VGRQSNANGVVNAVIEACGLYRVPWFRMQSRVVNIGDPNDRRGFRPFAVGKWTDEYGQEHSSGMADLLTHPKSSRSSVDHTATEETLSLPKM
jgi:hypothetical protein